MVKQKKNLIEILPNISCGGKTEFLPMEKYFATLLKNFCNIRTLFKQLQAQTHFHKLIPVASE